MKCSLRLANSATPHLPSWEAKTLTRKNLLLHILILKILTLKSMSVIFLLRIGNFSYIFKHRLILDILQ